MAVPKYKELGEEVKGFRCSWTYFNSLKQDGTKDQIGTLNFLTSERTLHAARTAVKSGKSVLLDAPLLHYAQVSSAFGGRRPARHEVTKVAPFAWEDSIEANTQASTQWDGARHFAIRKTGQLYNGFMESDVEAGQVLGMDRWNGVCGRGVLVDFKEWADARGENIDPNGGRSITLAEVKAVLARQRTTLLPGDILLVRTGWGAWYDGATEKERMETLCPSTAAVPHRFIGVASAQDFVEWLWDEQLAAVAADSPGFESTPPPDQGFGWLHEHLLAALGCPIGELWALDALAEECRARHDWTFLLASAPLRVVGGVASPANAIALL